MMAEKDHLNLLARDVHLALIIVGTIYFLHLLLPSTWQLGRDATDPKDGRSGLRLLTDAETGCQYLQREGITPRLGADGRQMGCRP